MILDVFWAGAQSSRNELATICKELTPTDYAIFIVTTTQTEFDQWIKEYELVDHVMLETPYITNGSHPEYGRRIKLVILSQPRKKDD